MIPASGKRPICAIIQARMGSERLPGKSLMRLAGKPLLHHVVQRALAATSLDRVILATTTLPDDGLIAQEAALLGVPVFRGDPVDVLDRYYKAAQEYGVKSIVRLTGDNPFVDPELVDRAVEVFLRQDNLDYLGNKVSPSYPIGLDVEVFSQAALRTAWQNARTDWEREHVTPYILSHPKLFKLKNLDAPEDLTHLRLTVDYPQDLELAAQIYAASPDTQLFGLEWILDLFEKQPQLLKINAAQAKQTVYPVYEYDS
jgi:spore coat polysaccharide biosynthesis protein SpsF